ncbi:MAG: hypothetical protein WB438_04465 [Candidatus Cybelea sp.]
MAAKKKLTKKADQKLAEEIGAAPSDPKQSKPSRKNAKAPKSKPEAPVSGKLTREQARSLWAPRVSEKKAPRKKK